MSQAFPDGTAVRVKAGCTAPEFPQTEIGGWSGTVAGKSGGKLIIQWDEKTIAAIPDDYRGYCEENQLLAEMACLSGDDLEAAE